ncbi:MAG: type IV toxin-antitoxin system AbiEi family antitoxin domain-containing protein [Actinomycetota bacterium]
MIVPDSAACARIAAAQHGVLSARQAASVGYSRHAVQRLVVSGAWTRVRPSVYALWIPAKREELWHHRIYAAALWLGKRAAVSHRAAGLRWVLDGIDAAPIEFTTTGDHRSVEAGLIVHRVGSLRADEVVSRGGLSVTSVARTLVDLSAVIGPLRLEMAMESALRRRLVTADQIQIAIDRAGRTSRGKNVLRSLLKGHPSSPTESALETLVWRLLRNAGLPLPVRQHEVRDAQRRVVARVDFAYPRALIAIEADGHQFHSSRRDWSRDRARQNALTRLGWTIYRVTWGDVTQRGNQVVEDIALLLAHSGTPEVWGKTRVYRAL